MNEYTKKDVADIFDKVRNGTLEIRPLFYDGSGRHPRYHYCDPPFENQWFMLLVLLIALPLQPIFWLIEKVKHE